MDKPPLWWSVVERAFDVLLKVVTAVFLLWGLAIFALVAYGIWRYVTAGHL